MKNQRLSHTAYLVGASLFGASKSHLDSDASHQNQITIYQDADRPIPTNEAGNCRANNHYLSSGFYDALQNPISEEEYWRQIEYEQESGILYARDKDAERANSKQPVSLLVNQEIECASNAATHITKQGTCYGEVKGQSIFVNSLPSNCEVITFTVGQCRDDPLDLIPFLNAASG